MMEELENQIIQAFRAIKSGKNSRFLSTFQGHEIDARMFRTSGVIRISVVLPDTPTRY